jgi:hypothetical protein
MVSPIFQPRFGEDKYPIGRFILERSRALALSRTDLVHRLRYRDIGSGHKALSAVLLTGVLAPHVANHIAQALEVDDAAVLRGWWVFVSPSFHPPPRTAASGDSLCSYSALAVAEKPCSRRPCEAQPLHRHRCGECGDGLFWSLATVTSKGLR